MQLSNSFPPADAAVEYLKNVDYKKLALNLLTAILYVVLFVYVLVKKVYQWWQNGGKESAILTLQKIKDFFQVRYTWIVAEAIPEVKLAHKELQDSYENVKQHCDNLVLMIKERVTVA